MHIHAHTHTHRQFSSVAEHWSCKPRVGGSIPQLPFLLSHTFDIVLMYTMVRGAQKVVHAFQGGFPCPPLEAFQGSARLATRDDYVWGWHPWDSIGWGYHMLSPTN